MSQDTSFIVPLAEEQDTIALAQGIAKLLLPGDLLILTGGLGAGKTFFTRALCYALGLDEDEPVTSPTFNLVQEYPTKPPVSHADLYRLGEPDEVFDLGLDARREQGELLVVEWGAPYVRELGGEAIHLDLTLEPRSGKVHGASERARAVVSGLLALDSLRNKT